MSNYQEWMNLKFGEVVTEEQFKWLQEIVFLSALEKVLSSNELAHRKEGEGPYPEQFELGEHSTVWFRSFHLPKCSFNNCLNLPLSIFSFVTAPSIHCVSEVPVNVTLP